MFKHFTTAILIGAASSNAMKMQPDAKVAAKPTEAKDLSESYEAYRNAKREFNNAKKDLDALTDKEADKKAAATAKQTAATAKQTAANTKQTDTLKAYTEKKTAFETFLGDENKTKYTEFEAEVDKIKVLAEAAVAEKDDAAKKTAQKAVDDQVEAANKQLVELLKVESIKDNADVKKYGDSRVEDEQHPNGVADETKAGSFWTRWYMLALYVALVLALVGGILFFLYKQRAAKKIDDDEAEEDDEEEEEEK